MSIKKQSKQLVYKERIAHEERIKHSKSYIPFVKYATFEFNNYEIEKARSIYERAINKFYNIIELWNSYKNMELKLKNYKNTRNIYKRIVQLHPLNNQIYKEFLNFERKYGNFSDQQFVMSKWLENCSYGIMDVKDLINIEEYFKDANSLINFYKKNKKYKLYLKIYEMYKNEELNMQQCIELLEIENEKGNINGIIEILKYISEKYDNRKEITEIKIKIIEENVVGCVYANWKLFIDESVYNKKIIYEDVLEYKFNKTERKEELHDKCFVMFFIEYVNFLEENDKEIFEEGNSNDKNKQKMWNFDEKYFCCLNCNFKENDKIFLCFENKKINIVERNKENIGELAECKKEIENNKIID